MTERPAWLVNRIADLTLQGNRDRAALERVQALPAAWLAATQEGQGIRREHWRGQDYVDGQDEATERLAEALLRALTEGASE